MSTWLKQKLALTQEVINRNMAEANKISENYYNCTAVNCMFGVGEKASLFDASTRKGEAAKLIRRWQPVLVLEKLTYLDYKFCEANTANATNVIVHIETDLGS
jgi:hypothetical protein